jgi:protein-tyrosine-phosphatase
MQQHSLLRQGVRGRRLLLQHGMGRHLRPKSGDNVPMSKDGKTRVLFLCTGNSCRSQMAEAILRQIGGDRFEALSAGSRPAGFIHPLALGALAALQVPVGDPVSKSWVEFADKPVEVVVTVCDATAAEVCPVFPGAALRAHWSLPDPVFHPGTDEERAAFAIAVAQRLRAKIEGLVALNWSAPPKELQRRLQFLGEI